MRTVFGLAPVARMGLPPALNPQYVVRPAKVVAVFIFFQPALLTGGLAGLSALWF